MRVTLKHECGHTRRMSVYGSAQHTSAVLFNASVTLCPKCEAAEQRAQAEADNPPCYACKGFGCGLCQYTGVL